MAQVHVPSAPPTNAYSQGASTSSFMPPNEQLVHDEPPMFPQSSTALPLIESTQRYQTYGTAANGTDEELAITKARLITFSVKSIRRGFIRKVFSIIAIQLAIVAGMVALFIFQDDCRRFVQTNRWFYILSFVVFFISYFAMALGQNVRRRFPGNMVCLLLLTLSMGYILASIAAFHSVQEILIALIITVVSCVLVVAFTLQPKYDFFGCVAITYVLSTTVLIVGIVILIMSLLFYTPVLYIVYCGIAAVLFMLYLSIDVSMILGGNRPEISAEDYTFAAVQVFLDIVNIFMLILILVDKASAQFPGYKLVVPNSHDYQFEGFIYTCVILLNYLLLTTILMVKLICFSPTRVSFGDEEVKKSFDMEVLKHFREREKRKNADFEIESRRRVKERMVNYLKSMQHIVGYLPSIEDEHGHVQIQEHKTVEILHKIDSPIRRAVSANEYTADEFVEKPPYNWKRGTTRSVSFLGEVNQEAKRQLRRRELEETDVVPIWMTRAELKEFEGNLKRKISAGAPVGFYITDTDEQEIEQYV